MTASAAKLSLLSSVVLRPAMWDATAEAWSRLIPHDWPGDHPAQLRDLVTSGQADMVEIHTPAGRVGFVVFHVDRSFPSPEFVIYAAYAADTERDLTAEVMPQLEELARSEGCATVRFHTMRPGLVVKALSAGFRVSEILMRKDIR